MLTRAEARKIALSVEGAAEGPYFGRPAIFVNGHFLTRVHDVEEAVTLAIGSLEMRDMMLEAEPELFYITDHYRPWPLLLVRLTRLDRKNLLGLLKPRAEQLRARKPKDRAAMKRKAMAKKAAKKAKKLTGR